MRPEPITSDEPGSLAWHVWHERGRYGLIQVGAGQYGLIQVGA